MKSISRPARQSLGIGAMVAAVLFAVIPVLTVAAEILPAESAFQLSADRTSDGRVRLIFRIAQGTYLYRDKIAVTSNGRTIPVETPPGTMKDDPTFGRTEVYYRQASVTFDALETGAVALSYQGCQEDGICYPPIRKSLDLTTLDFAGNPVRFALPAGSEWRRASDTARQAAPSAGATSEGGTIAETISDAGLPLLVVAFAGFGILLGFTPCVLPMYPILGGMLTRQGGNLSASRGFVVSLTYVMAMAAAFGVLGLAAAWTGQNLQVVLQSPVVIMGIAAVFALLAASMFGLFELAVPAAFASRVSSLGAAGKRGSLASAAALGFSSALIVGPCVTPPLAAALLYIAQTGDVTRGALALFALGFGQGIPLIAFGTFGSGLLPRAGAWMETVKAAFGFVFLAAAVWMISRILPAEATMALWSTLLIFAGVFAGAFDRLLPSDGLRSRLGKTAGLLFVLSGGFLAAGVATGGTDPVRPLAHLMPVTNSGAATEFSFQEIGSTADLRRALVDSSDERRPVLVYFTADWCTTCGVIDRRVFSDPSVRKSLAGFRTLEVDLSRLGESEQKLMSELKVVGPPTMLFYSADEHESPTRRIVGDVTADELLAAIGQFPQVPKHTAERHKE